MNAYPALRPAAAAVAAALALLTCGPLAAHEHDGRNAIDSHRHQRDHRVPTAPIGLGYADSAPVQDEAAIPPYVDSSATNQRGDACLATLATNAGVRVVSGFLDIWQPSTLLVDAGVSAPASGDCPAVVKSTWSGIPGDATDGTVLNAAVHEENIAYAIDATTHRTAEQELAAYLDDRRGKGYSVTDGLGPLTAAWRAAAQQTTTIADIPADATSVKYDDKGNNNGVGGSANASFGAVVDIVNNIGENGSTEPAKRFYKYARPWRWSADVAIVPALVPVKSTSPGTDGGFISGHGAEATRDAIAISYMMPERYQEMLLRGLELGENRILAGMHSPLDVMAGRVQAQAVATASLATGANSAKRTAAYNQAHATLMAAVGAADLATFNDFTHSQEVAEDRFADHDANKAEYRRLLTYRFAPINDTTLPAVVPKGAEVLLETRQPYLSDEQRRVVLKTTALPSGYPLLDDAEGWGRLNLFDAADGYGAFDGDVTVTMDAAKGGFNALDAWRNDISGAGKLTKQGSGTLKLTGNNGYSGGTEVKGGTLQADSASALGTGAVYVRGGTLINNAGAPLHVGGAYTQLADGALQLNLDRGNAGRLHVAGKVTIAGGALNVKFKPGYTPHKGTMLPVIVGRHLHGKFTTITVDGYKAKPIYTEHGLWLQIGGAGWPGRGDRD